MKVDDRLCCALGACGRWGAGVSSCTGEAGAGSASSRLSPTALLQEGEAGGVGNKLSLCSALGLLSSTVGTGRHAREDAGIQRRTWSVGGRLSGSVGRAGKRTCLLWAGPSAAWVLKSLRRWAESRHVSTCSQPPSMVKGSWGRCLAKTMDCGGPHIKQ